MRVPVPKIVYVEAPEPRGELKQEERAAENGREEANVLMGFEQPKLLIFSRHDHFVKWND